MAGPIESKHATECRLRYLGVKGADGALDGRYLHDEERL